MQKISKYVLGLFIFVVAAIGLTSINHPILLKWISGSARHHGWPIAATIYSNGKENKNIKLFYLDEVHCYLLSLPENESSAMLRFVYINGQEKWLGRPAAASKKDYDFILGHLFQSETGARFVPFEDDIKGFNFNPQLSISGGQIRFMMPPHQTSFDSIRIELN